jgi:hypothetical protein
MEHVAQIRETKYMYKILIRKLRKTGTENITLDLEEIRM